MSRTVGEPIDLHTKYGLVALRHVRFDDKEGVCLISKKEVRDDIPLPLRVQSSCLFGESFWATDCDCAWQLDQALSYIVDCGGMLVYFYEEGRGAGLEKKIEAIRLQQTARKNLTEAYACLQLEPDVRNYKAVGFIVGKLLDSNRKVSLFTNDPRKERLIREAGVNICERKPLIYDLKNSAVIRYLSEKAELLGHDIKVDGKRF